METLWYELWIDKEKFFFESAKEAYLYYLFRFATKEDFDYYRDCAKKELKDIADDEQLIGMVFDNVFDEKHHIYKAYKRSDGQVIRDKLC